MWGARHSASLERLFVALFVGSRGARRTLRYGRSSLKLPPTRIASRESLRLSALVMHRTFASLARGTQAQISPLRGAAPAGLRRPAWGSSSQAPCGRGGLSGHDSGGRQHGQPGGPVRGMASSQNIFSLPPLRVQKGFCAAGVATTPHRWPLAAVLGLPASAGSTRQPAGVGGGALWGETRRRVE